MNNSKEIKVKCPAKINLTLEILNKRKDGFHNIQSIMQTINLFDILTIKIEKSENLEINLSGTSDEIPYNEKNLVHKAAKLFFNNIKNNPPPLVGKGGERPDEGTNYKISVHIEKNIPIAAGLAGGSTDAAGTLLGLNQLLGNILSNEEIHELCAKLGSDLNFCLEGGCQLTTGRGEILRPLQFKEFNLSLIKPKNLGISAKEAYVKFSELENKPNKDTTTKFINSMNDENFNLQKYLQNDLEIALIRDYKELSTIKNAYPESLMSGSGSTFFILKEKIENISSDYWIKNNLKSIPQGVCKLI